MMFALCVGSVQNLTGTLITILADQYPAASKFGITVFVCFASFLISIIYTTPVCGFIYYYYYVYQVFFRLLLCFSRFFIFYLPPPIVFLRFSYFNFYCFSLSFSYINLVRSLSSRLSLSLSQRYISIKRKMYN